jgi:glycosyltransferase involved in cell wall biosynthesis
MIPERVVVLSSMVPTFSHLGSIVLGTLVEQIAIAGADVRFAHTGGGALLKADADAERRLALVGAHPVEGVAPIIDDESLPKSTPRRVARYVRETIDPRIDGDAPRFRDPAAEVERLVASGAGSALLFWDTHYERLVPALSRAGMRVYGYLARPPMAASQVHAREKLRGLKRGVTDARLRAKERRHLQRLRSLAGARNICALDASWYDRHGIGCRYLPNTWPDAFGDAWPSLRRAAEARREGIHILGNIGVLSSTGNYYGMLYLADQVLPLLKRELRADFTINICGRFEFPPALDHLRREPNVALRGFVPDIDEEMLGNHIFLVLNNAGPYPGGYTRVIFAFSSGSCLIAHRRLAESMPELVHDENCLLGDTPESITALIAAAVGDPALRSRIGEAARRTYLERYRPAIVADDLVRMMMGKGP